MLVPRARRSQDSTLPIASSECFKPFQHGSVRAPPGRPGGGAGGGAGLRERLPLHVEIDGGVAVCGRDAGVAEPLADRDDVDAGAEQVDGRAVSHAVGMKALGTQGRHRGLRAGAVLLQQVADAESGQPGPAVIAEDRLVGLQLAIALGQQGAQQVGGLGPQRADPFLSPLAVEADLGSGLFRVDCSRWAVLGSDATLDSE